MEIVELWRDENPLFFNDLKRSFAIIEVATKFNFLEIFYDAGGSLITNTIVIGTYQYGAEPLSEENGNINSAERMVIAPSGISTENYQGDMSYAFGVLLHETRLPLENRSQRLHEIAQKEENKAFVKGLIGTDKPSEAEIENYFATHHFLPGYLQNTASAITFVVSQVLAYKDSGKKIDFLLPKSIVHIDAIKQMLKTVGLSDTDVEWVHPNAKTSTKSDASIRILSYRIENDEDYQDLYFMSEETTMTSGDNSFALAMSANALPHCQYKTGPTGDMFLPTIPYYARQLLKELKESGTEDNKLIDGMEALIGYWEENIHYYSAYARPTAKMEVPSQKKSALPFATDVLTWDPRDEAIEGKEAISNKMDNYWLRRILAKHCERLAEFRKNPNITKAWQYFQEKMYQDQNLTENFTKVIKTIMHMAAYRFPNKAHPGQYPNGSFDLVAALCATPQLQQLYNENLFTEDDIAKLTSHGDISTFIALATEPAIATAFRQGEITIENLNEFCKQLHLTQLIDKESSEFVSDDLTLKPDEYVPHIISEMKEAGNYFTETSNLQSAP